MNLFYASTAYHVLLSYIIAVSDCNNENNALLLMGNSAANKTQQLFQQLFPSAFTKIVILESYPDHNNFKRLCVRKKNLREIKSLIEELCPIDKFYYTCDWKVEVNYISYLLQNTGTAFHYYDDGMATYMRSYKPSSAIAEVVGKCFYGKWRVVPKAEGRLNKNTHIHAILPELLPDIYEEKVKYKIDPSKMFATIKTENFPDDLIKYTCHPIELLLALPRTDRINDAFISIMQQQINALEKNGVVIAMKKHPRTLANDPVIQKINADGNIIDLPTEYPAELYYLLLSKSLKKIIGTTSTAMMTAKMLIPNVDISVVYTQESIRADGVAQKSFKLFEKMGIKLQEIVE